MDLSTTNDPLSDFVPNLPAADTSRPIPVAGSLLFRLTNCEPHYGKVDGSSEPDPNKKMWKLTWSLVNPTTSLNGRPIDAGYTLTEYVLLYQPEPKPGKQPFDFTAAIARRYDALMNTNNDTRPANYADMRVCVNRCAVLTGQIIEDAFGMKWEIKKHAPAPAGA